MSEAPAGRQPAGSAAVGAGDLLKWVGLLADGPVLWGAAVRSARPGVYLIELPAPLPHAPLDHAALRAWLERAPGLSLDGAHPTAHELAARLSLFWLSDQTVLYVGHTSRALGARLTATYRTPLGLRRPASGGHWLKALQGYERLRVWWSDTDAPEEYADALLSAFAEHVDPSVARQLHDTSVVLPFGNLETVTGVAKAHGISGALIDDEAGRPSGADEARPAGAADAASGRAPGAAGTSRPPAATHPARSTAGTPRARRASPTGTTRRRQAEPAAPARPTPEPVYLSAAGLEEVQRELDELVRVRRPENVARIRAARELGDLRENADYQIARTEQSFLEGRIRTLEEMVRNAVVIEPTTTVGQVALGSTVVVESSHGVETYTIVGSAEADPRNGRVSYTSPLGNALLGHGPGDEVSVATPGGTIQYRVAEVG